MAGPSYKAWLAHHTKTYNPLRLIVVEGVRGRPRYHDNSMTEPAAPKKTRSKKTSKARPASEPTVLAPPPTDNRVLFALIGGIVLGGAMVFFFGRYKLVSEDQYEQLVERAAGSSSPVVAPPQPPAAAGPIPPAGAPPAGAPPAGAPGPNSVPTNKLVGAKHSFDYAGSASKGPAKAKITVAIFSDFECPACAQWAPNINQMMTTFQGKLRFVFKHLPLPFHPKAKPAAIAAEAAGKQGKFWQMHDLLFKNQSSLERATFLKLAAQLGLDVPRFEKDLDDTQLAERVNRDFGEANRAGIPGTPTFYVDGQRADVGDPNSLHALLNDVVSGK